MQLAVKLGKHDVDKMLREITARQFFEWQAFAELEPFTELRQDYRTAQIAAMVFNMAVDPKFRKPIEEFVLDFEPEDEEEKAARLEREQKARIESHHRLIKALCMIANSGATEV